MLDPTVGDAVWRGVLDAGPTIKEYAVIFVGASVGALWPLSAAKTKTRWQGAKTYGRLLGTAMVLTSAGAWALEKHFGLPSGEGLWVASFFIAAIGPKWRRVLDAVAVGAASAAKAITTKEPS